MFFLLSDLFKIHSFHHYSLSSFIIVFERAITGKRAGQVDWSSDAVLDEIITEKKRALNIERAEEAAVAAGDSAMLATVDEEALQERLLFLVENITFSVSSCGRASSTSSRWNTSSRASGWRRRRR